MTRYRLSPRAQADVEAIWTYTVETWGSDQAESYIRQLRSGIDDIAADPRRGRPCDDIRPGYRKYNVGSHVPFCRLADHEIDVVRILHRRMDFDRHL